MFLAFLTLAAAASAPGCLDVSSANAPISLEGRLERHVYPGPPNYESIRRGDRAEPAYILVLDRPICISDGGQFADPATRFDRVHIFNAEDRLLPRFRAGIGHRVRIRGSGFASFNAHHHAPLVVRVDQLIVLRR